MSGIYNTFEYAHDSLATKQIQKCAATIATTVLSLIFRKTNKLFVPILIYDANAYRPQITLS